MFLVPCLIVLSEYALKYSPSIQVYVAPASSNGQGAVWTKIFSDSANGNSPSNWAVSRLIQARGQHSVTVPNLPKGQYLFRGKP
jgi:cellulase